jgi:diguanylate cyclase (GGDEF)-like protein
MHLRQEVIIDTPMAGKVVRGLFVANDARRCETWSTRAGLSVALNAAVVPTFRDAVAHLAEEPVEIVVLGTTIDDVVPIDALVDLNARFPTLPIVAIVDDPADVPRLLECGAFDVLLEDETPRLGATLRRAIRDVELGRALRNAHDELHDVLSASDRHLDLLTNAPALLWSTDDALVIRSIEGAGGDPNVIGRPIPAWDDRASDAACTRMLDAHRRALAGETTTIHLVWLGCARYVTVAPVRRDGRVSGTAGAALPSGADTTALAATSDPLRDVTDRQQFESRIGGALREAAPAGDRVAVFFIDVDRFKTVNDLAGHAAGDAVLRSIAERLARVLGTPDGFVRYSADTFVAMRAGLDDPAEGDALAAAILASFAHPFAYGEHEFHLTASVGVSCAPDDADDAERLIANAEAAVREAKRLGRNAVVHYVPTLLATPTDRHRLQRELSHAIERGQLDVFYQPVFDLASGRVQSAEALVRWRHPTLGLIVPDRFIPMAEETGLIDSIGEWVIANVCDQIRRWDDDGLPGVRVSVNVSARQLDRGGLLGYIRAAMTASGIAASSLVIEVTETSIMRDVYAAKFVLRELRALGLRVAIDDFGAGYTSLAFLRDMPIDDLKIDRSFVHGVAGGGFDNAVVRAIVMLARELGVHTIAEGVENPEQIAALRELRCDAVQGFFYAEPMTAAEYTPVLQRLIA